jgi:light-regulated signal transduction histidine kinase (bacteriophytochrome)
MLFLNSCADKLPTYLIVITWQIRRDFKTPAWAYNISSEIIKMHDGKIGITSELGKGRAFWFTLPLA